MWDLVSQVVTPTLKGICIFPKYYIGYFRSGTRRGFVSDRYVPEISEGYFKEKPSCDSFVDLSDSFEGKGCDEDFDWGMGDVIIVSASRS